MNSILAITCASITGITLGMALQHKFSITSTAPQVSEETVQQADLVSLPVAETLEVPSPPAQFTNSEINDPQLMKKLNALIQQQELMQNQQSELNREIHEIQFRLDTLSQDFRPLRTERNSESSTPLRSNLTSSPLLPPRR